MAAENDLMAASHLHLTTSNGSGNGSHSGTSDISVDNLYPAIFQCFAIILAGYIAGRANIITQTQGKGIGTFVGKFCLPALLFRSMVELNFDTVNWYFLLGIGISKTAVFFVVMVLTLLIKRPTHYGYAGLFAIFATQSNDFALGYPILKALYAESNPEYLQYIYLVAPISLVFLNPIGFTLMEIDKQQRLGATAPRRGKLLLVLQVVKDVLFNPIVFMTLIGIAGNFLFHQKMPNIIDDVLEVLGNAFSASALFFLGLSLVGKVQGQLGISLAVPLLLICAKTLILPLITWQVVGAFEMGEVNNSRSLSMYGFLYGTFPTAPSVFLYASQFSIAQDIVATGMVVCTFLSAPLMFASAKMMTVVVNSEMDYKSLLLDSSFDLSVISLVCNTWVLALLLLSRKFKKMPHHFLIFLIMAQMLSCIGMIIYDGLDNRVQWQHYLQFVLLLVGVFSTRCLTATLAVVMYLLHCRSLCFVLRIKVWGYFFGIGFPIVCAGLLLIFGSHHINNEIDPSFHYGSAQAFVSIVVLSLSSVINIFFLVLWQRNSRHSPTDGVRVKTRRKGGQRAKPGEEEDEEASVRERLLPDDSPRVASPKVSRQAVATKIRNGRPKRFRSKSCSSCTENCDANLAYQTDVGSTNIEDIVPFPGHLQNTPTSPPSSIESSGSEDTLVDTIADHTCQTGNCSYKQRQRCAGLLRCYHATNNIVQIEDAVVGEVRVKRPAFSLWDEYQTSRFIILLLTLQVSMFTGIFLCTWRMFNKGTSGIYVEIEFLDGFFNYGQSLVVFAIFGFDTRLMILPCIRSSWCMHLAQRLDRWRRWLYGTEAVQIPSKDQLPEEDRHLCDQFIKYHQDNCSADIVRDMKYRFRTYSEVFCGSSLCDWLIDIGLCQDRVEAVEYGRTLLRGQVISHVTSEHNFHDMPYFYRFTPYEEFD